MPNVNPGIIEWARSTTGLTLEEAAQALGLASANRLKAIEAGNESPSRPLLLKMSKQYRRSLLTFYLAEPPKKGDRGQDFRTLPDRSLASDALLDALIRDLRARQSLVRATLEDEEDPTPLPFIGSVRMADGLAAVLQSIKSKLKVDLTVFRSRKSQEEAFTYLRECAEDIGIFVLLIGNLGSHHSAIPVDAFRGFAIADKVAPFVVINDQDAKTAWSFTLLHEIAHLWLGTTGVSGTHGDTAIEQFCNDIAGELLLPKEELEALQIGPNSELGEMIALISAFARKRHLSRAMVAYKLHRSGAIDRSLWRALDGKFREMWLQEKAHQKARDGAGDGPSYYVVRRHRLGKALLEFASRNVKAGTLSPVKAAKVLGVKPRSVYPLLIDTPHRGPAAGPREAR